MPISASRLRWFCDWHDLQGISTLLTVDARRTPTRVVLSREAKAVIDGTAQHVVFVRLDSGSSETKIDDPDVVLAGMGGNPIKTGQNTLDRSLTVAVQNSHVQQ